MRIPTDGEKLNDQAGDYSLAVIGGYVQQLLQVWEATFTVRLLAIVLILTGQPLLFANNTQPEKPEEKATEKMSNVLGVGCQAPALRVSRWLQGPEEKEFAKNQIYVIHFWSVWCDPSISMMPQLGALQKEYREKGVKIIAFSNGDERGNSLDSVSAFVTKRSPKLGFKFAYADDGKTYDTWIWAEKRSIPCSFVIGKDGRIAYVGHPMYLVEVLPKVVAGTWSKMDLTQLAKVENEVAEVFNALTGTNPEESLNVLTEFQKNHPRLAAATYFVSPRISLLLKTKKDAEARKSAEDAIAKAIEDDDTIMLAKVSAVLRSPDARNNRDLLALSLKAAEAWQKTAGEKDMFALWNLAESYFVLGEREKARVFGAKAIDASVGESEAMKKYIQQQIKKYDEVKKEK